MGTQGTRPANLPEWASGGTAQITEPSLGKKQTGWTASPPDHEHFNWLQNRYYEWLEFLDTNLNRFDTVQDFIANTNPGEEGVVDDYVEGQTPFTDLTNVGLAAEAGNPVTAIHTDGDKLWVGYTDGRIRQLSSRGTVQDWAYFGDAPIRRIRTAEDGAIFTAEGTKVHKRNTSDGTSFSGFLTFDHGDDVYDIDATNSHVYLAGGLGTGSFQVRKLNATTGVSEDDASTAFDATQIRYRNGEIFVVIDSPTAFLYVLDSTLTTVRTYEYKKETGKLGVDDLIGLAVDENHIYGAGTGNSAIQLPADVDGDFKALNGKNTATAYFPTLVADGVDYSFDINGTTFTYTKQTGDTTHDVADAFRALIETTLIPNGPVTAAYSSLANKLIIRAFSNGAAYVDNGTNVSLDNQGYTSAETGDLNEGEYWITRQHIMSSLKNVAPVLAGEYLIVPQTRPGSSPADRPLLRVLKKETGHAVGDFLITTYGGGLLDVANDATSDGFYVYLGGSSNSETDGAVIRIRINRRPTRVLRIDPGGQATSYPRRKAAIIE